MFTVYLFRIRNTEYGILNLKACNVMHNLRCIAPSSPRLILIIIVIIFFVWWACASRRRSEKAEKLPFEIHFPTFTHSIFTFPIQFLRFSVVVQLIWPHNTDFSPNRALWIIQLCQRLAASSVVSASIEKLQREGITLFFTVQFRARNFYTRLIISTHKNKWRYKCTWSELLGPVPKCLASTENEWNDEWGSVRIRIRRRLGLKQCSGEGMDGSQAGE